jgi:hypothetical protein
MSPDLYFIDQKRLDSNLTSQLDEATRTRAYWNTSIFDLAAVIAAETPNFEDEDYMRFLEKLLKAQNPDGSWGDGNRVPHSALVDTLGAIFALIQISQRHDLDRFSSVIEHARECLPGLLIKCSLYRGHDPVGYELIVPLMLKYVGNYFEQCGQSISLPDVAALYVTQITKQGNRRMNMARREGLFLQPGNSSEFTAEVGYLLDLDGRLPAEELARVQTLSNQEIGGVGHSPSATALTARLLMDHGLEVPPKNLDYLNQTLVDYDYEGFPNLHRISNTTRLWHVLPIILSDEVETEIQQNPDFIALLTQIYNEFPSPETGWSWDNSNSHLPDLDDTSVAFAIYNILVSAGVKGLKPMSLETIQKFRYEDGNFFCFYGELNSAPTHVLHAFKALEVALQFNPTLKDSPEFTEMYQSLLRQVRGKSYSLVGIMHDKWHSSELYTLQRWLGMPSVLDHNPVAVKMALQAVLAMQHGDGGWSKESPNLEETIYALEGLLNLLQVLDRNQSIYSEDLSKGFRAEIIEALTRGAAYFEELIDQPKIPVEALWLSKTVYAPWDIIIGNTINMKRRLSEIKGLIQPEA